MLGSSDMAKTDDQIVLLFGKVILNGTEGLIG